MRGAAVSMNPPAGPAGPARGFVLKRKKSGFHEYFRGFDADLFWPVLAHEHLEILDHPVRCGQESAFLLIIEVGYICGMLNKVLVRFDWVFFLYVLNFLMVGTDVVLYFRNKRLDRLRAEQEG